MRVIALTIVLAAVAFTAPASAQVVAPPFDATYSLTDIGSPAGCRRSSAA